MLLCAPENSAADFTRSYIGSVNNWAKAVLMWNIALDSNGQPQLPGTASCKNPVCRGVVTITGGSYTLNEECELVAIHRLWFRAKSSLVVYAMAQASRAIIPKDPGGPWGQRIGVNVVGSSSQALRVSAFVTKRTNPTDWWRYNIVVLNLCVSTPRSRSCYVEDDDRFDQER